MSAPDERHIGPYRLLSPLGAGGFGEVHLGLDPQGRTVAVKLLHPQLAADTAAVTRLAREVETMRRVRGPHVAEVVDAWFGEPRPYIVTRYVQGRSLAAVVAETGPVRGDDLTRLTKGLAEALASIHAAGVIHRDLKPANVLMADGEPRVIDFGIAVAWDSASVTASGAVVGTPGYLAPEVLEGGSGGPAADVFAWAATLAFAATGRQPYGTGPAPAVAYRVVHHEPDLEDVPDWLATMLGDCLRADPAARPTAARLCALLGVPIPAATPPSGSAAPAGSSAVSSVVAAGGEPSPAPGALGGGVPPSASPGVSPPVSPEAPPAVFPAGAHPGPVPPAVAPAASGAPGGFPPASPVVSPSGPPTIPPAAGPAAPGPFAGAYEPLPGHETPLDPAASNSISAAETREWRPGRREERVSPFAASRARHREKIRRRWVIGSGVFVSLLAAAARDYLPEVSLLLLAAYGLGVLTDAFLALRARSRSRILVDLGSAVGAVALWAGLSAAFSTLTLLLAVGTVLAVLLTIVFAS